KLEVSEDPLRLALQYAMVGNYIDFGAVGIVDETYLTALLKDAALNSVDERTFAQLKLELESAEKLVYLTDNCGEIVMDKLLIGQLKALYPQMELTVIVRGGEVLNDATVEDAVQVGLTELVPVIDNGNSIAGTWMDEVSAQARHVMEDADLILAKGQANYETLRGCGMNIYYIFLCKCEMFARMFQVPRFSGMLLKERETGIGI
ncbi:MAG: DUF89 family protein, partial [Lachnospiraceae bacterium]|nr:DUF89 family protein [Lachnospiraceae bacterium]